MRVGRKSCDKRFVASSFLESEVEVLWSAIKRYIDRYYFAVPVAALIGLIISVAIANFFGLK